MNVVYTDIEILQDHHARTHIIYAVGHKQIHAVVLDKEGDGPAVKLRQLPLVTLYVPRGSKTAVQVPTREYLRLRPLLFRDKPYPLGRAIRTLKRAGSDLGITAGASEVLDQLKEHVL